MKVIIVGGVAGDASCAVRNRAALKRQRRSKQWVQ